MFQGAAFAGPEIAVEVTMTALLIFSASRLPASS
jgi:hypothetical protein